METKHYEPLTKRQSGKVQNNEKVHLQKSKVKTMLIIFYNSD